MSHKGKDISFSGQFDPEKITLIDFKMIKAQIDAPEDFQINLIEGFELDNSFNLSFNLKEKLAKADFRVNVKTLIPSKTSLATGLFHLIFIYKVENLDELTIEDNENKIIIHSSLESALASVSYSTARGILLTRLQGTAFQSFVLPIINPNKLMHLKSE